MKIVKKLKIHHKKIKMKVKIKKKEWKNLDSPEKREILLNLLFLEMKRLTNFNREKSQNYI